MNDIWKIQGIVRLSKYLKWRSKLSDNHKGKVDSRILQAEHGYICNFKNLKKSLFEFRWDCTLRVYFSRIEFQIIVLFGSTKKSKQNRAIRKSRGYLEQYKNGELA